MNFHEAEQKFRVLEQNWSAGRVTEEVYSKALASLRVVDASGQTWMLQAHTGRWFVQRAGQWVAAAPPSAAPAPVPAAAPVVPAASRKSKKSLALILGLVGVCLVGTALVAGGVFAFTKLVPLPDEISLNIPLFNPPAADNAPAAPPEVAEIGVKTLETVAAAPDGLPHVDSHGVSLVVPSDALEQGGLANLVASNLNAPWRKDLEAVVTIDTPFYSLSTPGKNDSTGSLSLRIPASNPQTRLLAVVDNEYLVELAQPPQNGALTLQTRAAPTDTTELAAPAGYDGNGTIYYAAITPKSAALPASGIHLASLTNQADERSCVPDISLIGGTAINLCRQNPEGTLYVMLPTTKRELLPQVDIMVDKISAVMQKYYSLGFTSAQLTHSSPMMVRVSTRVTSPSYYPLNGVLYIPVDSVARIASLSPTDVYHEMAHWIQAVKYSTRLAYYSDERTWWLETSAENMVMLVEPEYVGSNLQTYGTISTEGSALAFQSSPYQWPGDYYIHAQLLKINLCDSAACPLSPASFARAISDGTYPLMNGVAKSMVGANLKDYAFYLLGKPPAAANTAIPLTAPVKSGQGYGEFVRIARTNNVDLKFDYNGSDPQMRKETVAGKETLVIQASIQRDGVYPLAIFGGEGNNPGLPVEVLIDPGASFYYTVDDGALQYADGSSEVKILPVHGSMGIRKVRIVALGINGGEVFKARVQPLSLEGAWVVMPTGQKTGGAITCDDEGTENPDGIAWLMAYITGISSGLGDMHAEPTGRNFDYTQVASRVPAEFAEAKVTFNATALLSGASVKYQATVDIPKADEGASIPPGVPLAAAAFLPALWFGRKHLNTRVVRVSVNVLVIGIIVLVSTGCFGMGMYGSSTVDANFDKIEYLGGEDAGSLVVSEEFKGDPQGKPIWKMTGKGTYAVTFYIETTVTNLNGPDTTEVETCIGQVTYPVAAYIYKDFSVQLPADE